MWLDYIRERMPNKSIVEIEEAGFAIYYPFPAEEAMYIEEIYVVPKLRKSNLATDMMITIENKAKEDGFKYLMGSNDPTTAGAEGSMMAMFKRGFKLDKMDSGLIFLRKEIQ